MNSISRRCLTPARASGESRKRDKRLFRCAFAFLLLFVRPSPCFFFLFLFCSFFHFIGPIVLRSIESFCCTCSLYTVNYTVLTLMWKHPIFCCQQSIALQIKGEKDIISTRFLRTTILNSANFRPRVIPRTFF